jgi:AcrR family transcriptional regulator
MATAKPPTPRAKPQQLPRGRHSIPPEQVAQHQRVRMLEAIARSVGDKGYAATSVQDVLERAGVSRKTFYDNFADKEACFLEAYDAVVARVMHEVNKRYAEPGPWPQRVRIALGAFLNFFAYEQDLARMTMVEVLAAGPQAVGHYRAAITGFVGYFEEGRLVAAHSERVPEQTSEAVVGGLASVIYNRVADGRADEVPKLLPGLLYFALLPYIGPAQAAREAAKASTS